MSKRDNIDIEKEVMDIINLEGLDEEIDNNLYEVIDKWVDVEKNSDSIRKLYIKENIRKGSNVLLVVLVVGTVMVPDVFLLSAGCLTILKLITLKSIGFRRSNKKKMEALISKKKDLEIEVIDLIKEIKRIKVECDSRGLNSDKIEDKERENNYSYTWDPAVNQEVAEDNLIIGKGKPLKRERRID